jgi:hypothetical protein
MNIQIEEFRKVALEARKIHIGVVDGVATIFVHNHGVTGVTYFLATAQGKTKKFKSLSSLEKFFLKYPTLYDCELSLGFPNVSIFQIDQGVQK